MEDFESVDAYIRASELWPEELRRIRPLLLACGLDEKIKWGKPCYCIDEDDNVVLLQEFSEHLALLFFKGVLLADEHGVLREQGPNSHGPRRMEFTSPADVEQHAAIIAEYVNEAIGHTRAGTELPPRPEDELADELLARLGESDEFAAAFNDLTPGRQREYNLHICGAKQSETRERRVDKIVPRVLAGKGLRDR